MKLTLEMRSYSNEKYKVFQKLWLSFDNYSVFCSISISFWLVVHFMLYGVLDNSIKVSRQSLGLMLFFYLIILTKIGGIWEKICLFFILAICFLQIELDVTRAVKNTRNFQNIMCFGVVLCYVVMCFSEAMQTEADSIIDSFLMALLAITYFNYKSDLKEKEERKKKYDDIDDLIDFGHSTSKKKKVSVDSIFKANFPFLLIVFSIKMSFYFDRERSLNFPENSKFTFYKNVVQKDFQEILCFAGIIGLILIENLYINSKYKLGRSIASRWLSNIISLMLIVNTYFLVALQSGEKEGLPTKLLFNPMGLTFEELELFNTRLTWFIFGSVLVTLIFIVSQFKIYQKLKYRNNLIAE